jgi:segregation and condensation protein A
MMDANDSSAIDVTPPDPSGCVRTVVGNQIDFSATLDTFQGPLDLLLYLIKENEVDIIDIKISPILDQYLRFMDQATQWDLQLAGEFLVMATTLMEIKSRELLPVQQQSVDVEEIIEDPRSELVRQLLAYRRLKEQARELDILQDRWVQFRPRGLKDDLPLPVDGEDAEAERALAREALVDVDLYGLFAAYERILKATMAIAPRDIVYDGGESIEEKIKRIESILKTRPFARFVELLNDTSNRADIAATFVALLELVRRRAVRLIQQQDFGHFEVKVQDETEAEQLSKQEAAEAEAHAEAALNNRAELEAAQAAQGTDKLPWKKKKTPPRPKFGGIIRPEDIEEIDTEEHEIGRRIDAILAAADAINERFEQSREGRVRDEESLDPEVSEAIPLPIPFPVPTLEPIAPVKPIAETEPVAPVVEITETTEPIEMAEPSTASEPTTSESDAIESRDVNPSDDAGSSDLNN